MQHVLYLKLGYLKKSLYWTHQSID